MNVFFYADDLMFVALGKMSLKKCIEDTITWDKENKINNNHLELFKNA